MTKRGQDIQPNLLPVIKTFLKDVFREGTKYFLKVNTLQQNNLNVNVTIKKIGSFTDDIKIYTKGIQFKTLPPPSPWDR